MQLDDLPIPAFLDRRGQKSRPWRSAKWSRLPKAERPAGDRWVDAERWEVNVPASVPNLACGWRRLWVVEGRKWSYLHDAEAQVRVHISEWRLLQRKAKQVP